jgi:hypothetical protein
MSSVNNLDIILSFNHKYIVINKTRIFTGFINNKFGYKKLDIYTPNEAFDYVNYDYEEEIDIIGLEIHERNRKMFEKELSEFYQKKTIEVAEKYGFITAKDGDKDQ